MPTVLAARDTARRTDLGVSLCGVGVPRPARRRNSGPPSRLTHRREGTLPRQAIDAEGLGVGECHYQPEFAAGCSDERAECQQQHIATVLQPGYIWLVHLQELRNRRLRQLSRLAHLRALPDAR